MVTDIMIDTEFLSLKYDAYILSIGAVSWDMKSRDFEVLDSIHIFPSMESQGDQGAKIDEGTFQWWLSQSVEAKAGIIEGQRVGGHIGIIGALHALSSFMRSQKGFRRVWSHGLVCDLPLLKHWYDKLNMKTPWHYQTPRDTRTLFDCYGEVPEKKFTVGVAHDALADAIVQAEQVFTAWKGLRGGYVSV